jgi:signal recognition particle receptor subunit beta
MAIINHAKREINAKIVYYGDEGVGKGTSLRYVYGRIKPALRGELKSLATAGSLLLFFDFTPFERPLENGYRIRFQIYTLNGAATNPAAWKMMLKGTDGVVVVAEAAQDKLTRCSESVMQLREVLNSYGVALDDIPLLLQLNKSDQAASATLDEAASLTRIARENILLTRAKTGDGVLEVLTALSRKIMARIGESADLPEAVRETETEASGSSSQQTFGLDKPERTGVSMDESPEISPHVDRNFPVRVAPDGICMAGGFVRIPVEFEGAAGMTRFTVTVSVEPG